MKIYVVVVTYNRKKYLIKLLEKLKLQTYKIDTIVIFDNNSTDGTYEELDIHGYLNKNDTLETKFIYHKNSENLGGSGGFYKGMKLAMAYNPDFIWAMDDDVYPENDCLEVLVGNMDNRTGICIPNRTGNGFSDYAITKVNMSNPFLYATVNKKTKVYSENVGTRIKVYDMPFEGPLIKTDLIRKIGYPNKDLFILYDDSEFAMRASKSVDLFFVKDAHLYKQIIPQNNIDNVPFTWKSYYDIRNGIWFDRQYGENIFVRYCRPLLTILYWYGRLTKNKGLKYLKYVNKAYVDGTKNNLGKIIDPARWS